MLSTVTIILAGAAGALIKDILEDSTLKLPHKTNHELKLGCLGGMATGAAVGFLTGSDPITAFIAGYAGNHALTTLMHEKIKEEENPEDIEKKIREIAKRENVDPDLAVRVAFCESRLDPKARNINEKGSVDRGIFQINSKWHAYVSDKEADDPEFATRFFCKAVNSGNLSWWNATRKCWEK